MHVTATGACNANYRNLKLVGFNIASQGACLQLGAASSNKGKHAPPSKGVTTVQFSSVEAGPGLVCNAMAIGFSSPVPAWWLLVPDCPTKSPNKETWK